jgi:hypothetical protein
VHLRDINYFSGGEIMKLRTVLIIALSLILSWFLGSQTAHAAELNELTDQLKRNSSRARARAASALGKLGDKRAVQPLFAMLKDEDEEVRRSATEALRKLGWQPGTEVE